MNDDDVKEHPAEVVAEDAREPVRYTRAQMELVVDARQRSAAYLAARGDLPMVDARVPLTPLAAAVQAKRSEIADKVGVDPVVLAHRFIAPTYQLELDAASARQVYRAAAAGAARASGERMAARIRAEFEAIAAGKAPEEPSLRFG